MSNNICPHCSAELEKNLLYQCIRCFTKYCKECEGADEGRRCPKCGMGCRLLVSVDTPKGALNTGMGY